MAMVFNGFQFAFLLKKKCCIVVDKKFITNFFYFV